MSGECDKCGEHAVECECEIIENTHNFINLSRMNYPEDDSLFQMARKIYEERQDIIDMFCKAFFVSQDPRSPEELRALFEMAEMEITQNSDLSQTIRIKLKEFDQTFMERHRQAPELPKE